MIGLSIVILLLFVLGFALYDKKQIQSNTSIDHSLRAFARSLFFLLNALIIYPGREDILSMLSWVMVEASFFWIMFDIMLNLLRGVPWHLVGDAAWLDRIFHGNALTQYLVKSAVLGISITTHIHTL